MTSTDVTIDANEAAAHVAFKTNEVIAIYPITPSSPMGELADEWSTRQKKNIWGTVPVVVEMQSEGGAAGALHGALQAGSLCTTFTASQGLLLMIPNMYKIAGELTSTVFHIASRSVATHALSIFGDHSDVMAARMTGWAMLFSGSVQEVMDLALVSQAATLEARVPFLHVFDGFRTSHEVAKVQVISPEVMSTMIDDGLVRNHRARSMSPDRPFIRGTAQNPDVFFQAREAINPFYLATPEIVQNAMNQFAQLTGRQYQLFDYVGSPEAERVLVLMGSGGETAEETVAHLVSGGEKVGLIKVRLFRPFSVSHFLSVLPTSTQVLGVLDRTKEPGSIGEPLYQDIVSAVSEGISSGTADLESMPWVIGGRYGLSSKEFTPAMIKGVFDEMAKERPKNHFTVGIVDDVTHTSLDYDPAFEIEREDEIRAVFWGLGSDGTVSANRNSIRIIGEGTPWHAQGYFVYDSKKAGACTVSHLRFGPRPIRSAYLIQRANFVAVHQFGFLQRYAVLNNAAVGATFLLNSPYGPNEVWDHLPRDVQEQIIDKELRFFVIDAYKVARETGLGTRINTVMQPCFFALSGVLPREEAIFRIKDAIRKTYGKRGESVVQRNFAAVDSALTNLYEVEVPDQATSGKPLPPTVPTEAPEFVQKVTASMLAGDGDLLPVSALPSDGTYPSATARWEKRQIALEVPVWEPDLCIQCGKCVLVCPHSVIRAKVLDAAALEAAPESFKSHEARWREFPESRFTLQTAVDDCTGCSLCVQVCPARDRTRVSRRALNMRPVESVRERQRKNWDFFLSLPDRSRVDGLAFHTVKNVQLLRSLFEFSGACAGCGETPYLSLLTQLFGDRALVANATGCSSIYGGNLPTTPWAVNSDGRGPAWSNSLFEDNAEFGLGVRLALDKQTEQARELLNQLRELVGTELARSILEADQSTDAGIEAQRLRVEELKDKLKKLKGPGILDLLALAGALVKKSVWIVGGDGWAYDIGYGGLDHVLASGYNVNVLVLDTEVYSNTGGQASKATPMGAIAKFAAGGKTTSKKDLGLMAMTGGNAYVAQVALGANDTQTVKAFLEAEAYDGPSMIIAYSQCIAHGIDMSRGLQQQKLAADSGYWILYRYNPDLKARGKNPLQLDSRPPKVAFEEYAYKEARYHMLAQTHPDVAKQLLEKAEQEVKEKWERYQAMAKQDLTSVNP